MATGKDLTHDERERLALLAEEMAEAIQIIGKVLRHGYESVNPATDDGLTNRDLLATELGHVHAAMCVAFKCGDVQELHVLTERDNKLSTVRRWLHSDKNKYAASLLLT